MRDLREWVVRTRGPWRRVARARRANGERTPGDRPDAMPVGGTYPSRRRAPERLTHFLAAPAGHPYHCPASLRLAGPTRARPSRDGAAMPIASSQVTALLRRWGAGDRDALDQAVPLVYDRLRQLAHRHRRRAPGATLGTTAVVHE